MPKVTRKRAEDKRPKRVPLHEQGKDLMTVPERAGYVRRWVNDNPGRINRFITAGWSIVEEETKVGDEEARVHNKAVGSGARIHASTDHKTGKPVEAVLMEIKETFYDQDQKAKQAVEDEKMEELNRKLDAGELAFTR